MDRSIEPRLNQIFMPLLSIIEDEKTKNDIRELIRTYNQQMIADRGLDIEAQVLDTIKDLNASGISMPSVKEIANSFNESHGEEYDHKITAKYIGNVIRTKLSLKTKKVSGVFVIPVSEYPKLKHLYERYGLGEGPEHTTPASPQSPSSPQPPQDSPSQEPYLLDE